MSPITSRRRALVALVGLGIGLASLAVVPASAKAICAADGHPGGEWPMMGYDLGHSRHQIAERSIGRLEAARLQPAWTFSVNDATGEFPSEVTGYPIVSNGCVYFGSNAGQLSPGWLFAVEADGGQLVWKKKISNGVYSTAAVANGIVYFFASRVGSPYVIALDQFTGEELWRTTVDRQSGSDAVSSPIVYDGMLWVGISGTAAEGDEATRFDFRGTFVILDAGRSCANTVRHVALGADEVMDLETTCANAVTGATGGSILAHTYSIPDTAWDEGEGDAGGAIWSTISIDERTKYGFVGTGNPFNYENEHVHTNAALKIDMDRARPTFGQITASYKGDVEEYFPAIAENFSCDEDDAIGFFLAGFECGRLDLDFGASPNIITDRTGRVLVGIGQKSGVYHVFDPAQLDENGNMTSVWKQVMGVPSLVGGIVGTPAYDGVAIYAPHTIGGYLAALDRGSGAHRWISPVGDGVHWGSPVTSANGVIYTVDLKGFLDAYDASTGAPLLHRPLPLSGDMGVTDTPFSWGGVTIARNTVYASVGVGLTSAGEDFPALPDGYVIAFRPKKI